MDIDRLHNSSLHSEGEKSFCFAPQQCISLNARSATETSAGFTSVLKPDIGFVY